VNQRLLLQNEYVIAENLILWSHLPRRLRLSDPERCASRITRWCHACFSHGMADDTTKTAPQDAKRINVHEDYEVRYWIKRLGCTPEQLKAAVKKAGVMVDDVQKELNGK
jgi:hypothetical protein